MPKYSRYQDYVIRGDQLVGEFEQMYRDFDDPWEQTVREQFASEKAVAINLISRLKANSEGLIVVELGCGFGDFTARIAQTGVKAIGIDLSGTAVVKARGRHPGVEFHVGQFSDRALIASLKPDVIVMAEITWYVLEHLQAFQDFLFNDLPDTYLLHLLMTYAPGVQQYGRGYFTNLDEIKRYFALDYLEAGLVEHDGGARTWFLGRPPRKA